MRLRDVLIAAAFGVFAAGAGIQVAAQGQGGAAKTQAAYQVPDGPVQVYGQMLNPQSVVFKTSDYTWADLKDLMPQILPSAQSETKTPEQLCDHIVPLSDLYGIQLDKAEGELTEKIAPLLQGDRSDFEVDVFVGDRLSSKDPKKLDELIALLPDDVPQIMMVKDLTLKHLTMIALRDAAIANCPDYAKQQGYKPITTYSGPDAGYMPEEFKPPVGGPKN